MAGRDGRQKTEDGLSFVARLPSPFSVALRRVKVYGGQALAKMEGQNRETKEPG